MNVSLSRKRFILLPPSGFTSNSIDELSCHPETRKAKIKIKGAIRPQNTGFIKLKNAIKFAQSLK